MAAFTFKMPVLRIPYISLAIMAICLSFAGAAPLPLEPESPTGDVAARTMAAGPYSGDMTFYYPGGNYGSCGTPLNNGDKVVAFAVAFFDQYTPNGNPNHNTLCGKKVEITSGTRKTVVTVADRCTSCVGHDIDITSPSFQALVQGGLAVGRTKVTWRFLN